MAAPDSLVGQQIAKDGMGTDYAKALLFQFRDDRLQQTIITKRLDPESSEKASGPPIRTQIPQTGTPHRTSHDQFLHTVLVQKIDAASGLSQANGCMGHIDKSLRVGVPCQRQHENLSALRPRGGHKTRR
jgi:hypothetical protein